MACRGEVNPKSPKQIRNDHNWYNNGSIDTIFRKMGACQEKIAKKNGYNINLFNLIKQEKHHQ